MDEPTLIRKIHPNRIIHSKDRVDIKSTSKHKKKTAQETKAMCVGALNQIPRSDKSQK
uniref:Uncharacterized protein n=1 Tax=Cucumis melo TaxID=3656 RepID=A0A9I9DSE3_CUCME